MENGLTSHVRAQKWDRRTHKALLVRLIPVGLEVVNTLKRVWHGFTITIERHTCTLKYELWPSRANVWKLELRLKGKHVIVKSWGTRTLGNAKNKVYLRNLPLFIVMST